jgi:integrase
MRCAEAKGHKVEVPEATYLPNEVEPPWYTADSSRRSSRAPRPSPADLVMILLAGEAGLRSGEVSALRWMDVDLGKREVHIRRNLVRGHEGTPKGGKDRHVPMSLPPARRARPAQAQEGGVGRVLRREDGSDMTTDSQRTCSGASRCTPGCRPTACTRSATASARG